MLNLNESSDDNKIELLEEFNSGINGEKLIFKINDRKFLFKSSKMGKRNNIDGDLIEVFCSRILENAKMCSFLPYDFAMYKDYVGCISPLFLTDNTLYTLSLSELGNIVYTNNNGKSKFNLEFLKTKDFSQYFTSDYKQEIDERSKLKTYYLTSVEETIKWLEQFCKSYDIAVNLEDIRFKLNEFVICDYFLCNADRNFKNIEFLIKDNKGKKELQLAPNFDLGFSFRVYHYPKYLKLITSNKQKDSFVAKNGDVITYSFDSILHKVGAIYGITEMASKVKFVKNGTISNAQKYEDINNLNVPGYIISFFENSLLANNGVIAVDIYGLTREDERYKNLVDYFLNLDIIKEITKFEIDENVKVDQTLKDFMEEVFLYRREIYKRLQKKLINKIEKNVNAVKE